MGVLDLLFPLFFVSNRFLEHFLPQAGLIIFYAVLATCLSMGMYIVLSPQKRLGRLKHELVATRKEISIYQDSFGGVVVLGRRLLFLTAKQVWLTSGPAMVAAVPAIIVYVLMSYTFGLDLPENGVVKISFFPKDADVALVIKEPPQKANGVLYVRWSSLGPRFQIQEGAGQTVASFESEVYVPEIHKRRWWNLLWGNPAGYIDGTSSLERVEFGFKPSEFFHFGPGWLREWRTLFFGAAFLLSILLKTLFKIH